MKSACFDIWIVRGILTRLVPFSYWIIFISKNILWLLPKYWMFFAFWRVSYCITIFHSWSYSEDCQAVSHCVGIYTQIGYYSLWFEAWKHSHWELWTVYWWFFFFIFRCKIKIVDFGGSNFTTSSTLSSYIQSRAYRAPEVYFCLFFSF